MFVSSCRPSRHTLRPVAIVRAAIATFFQVFVDIRKSALFTDRAEMREDNEPTSTAYG